MTLLSLDTSDVGYVNWESFFLAYMSEKKKLISAQRRKGKKIKDLMVESNASSIHDLLFTGTTISQYNEAQLKESKGATTALYPDHWQYSELVLNCTYGKKQPEDTADSENLPCPFHCVASLKPIDPNNFASGYRVVLKAVDDSHTGLDLNTIPSTTLSTTVPAVTETPTAPAKPAKVRAKKRTQLEDKTNGGATVSVVPPPSHTQCTYPDCTKKKVKGQDMCYLHGGFKLCMVEGCTKRSRTGGKCSTHGGGTRCKFEGCKKRSEAAGKCYLHGGRKICSVPGCVKAAQLAGKCRGHGGKKQCKLDGCTITAEIGGICGTHGGRKQCTKCPKRPASGSTECTAHGGGGVKAFKVKEVSMKGGKTQDELVQVFSV